MILHRILSTILICLALTVIIEAAFAFIFGVRSGRGQLVVLLTNIITNPVLNCILTVVSFYLPLSYYNVFLVPLEVMVVFIEGFIYKKMLTVKLNPFLLSLLLNVCSFFLGNIIYKFIV